MTDKELLELAAKAAGIKITYWDGVPRNTTGFDPAMNICAADVWSPLTDDGDALRLAVKLGLTPHLNIDHRSTYVATDDVENPEGYDCIEKWTDDPCAATRRAIVRAAAEIGKAME